MDERESREEIVGKSQENAALLLKFEDHFTIYWEPWEFPGIFFFVSIFPSW
jgi:hypothetical protein